MSRDTAVAVTGIGVVSPIGIGRDAFWRALCAGESGVACGKPTPESVRESTISARVRGFNAKAFITSAHYRRMDPFSRMIVAASRMALDDAQITLAHVPPEHAGVVVGSALGDVSESVTYLEKVFTKGPPAASPMLFPNLVLNSAAAYVSMELGSAGINLTVAQGETSGEQAIMLAAAMVRAGRAAVVLAGGGDEWAPILSDIYRMGRALSGQRGGGEWSSPYDRLRNGVVLGEGAAMLVLETVAHARARGATIYAEIASDIGFSVPAPPYDWPVEASAALPTLRRVLDGWTVDLVCGAANSSRRLDAYELDLFARLCSDRARAVHVTSIKGAIGEFNAAGALTVASACLALREQSVPPLCHLRDPEPGVPCRFAAAYAQPARLDRALVCGMARGGAGAAIVLRRSE